MNNLSMKRTHATTQRREVRNERFEIRKTSLFTLRPLPSLRLCVLSLCVVSLSSFGQNAIPAPRQSKPVALVGGTVHPVSGPVIERATVVFDGGKITAVGTDAQVPAGAERVDVTGRHVFPGIIDAYNSVGLEEINLGSPGTMDQVEAGSINPSIRAEVAFHQESEHIPVARSGGITTVYVCPQGGLIAGLSAAMMLEGWTWEEMTLKSRLALIVNWPTMVYSPNPFSQQTKEDWLKQRNQSLDDLKKAFDDARAYRTAKQAAGASFDTDPRWEAMIPVLEGTVPVVVNASELSQIEAALAFAGDQRIRLILAGARDAWRVTDQLKAKGIPVIVTDIQTAGRRWEAYDAVFTLAKRLNDAGVKFCVTGDRSSSNSRNVPFHAAQASAYGLPHDEALRAITLYPAQIFGLADRVGSIDVGKDANLLITDGDILEISTKIHQVYIQGRKVDMRDKHTRLYEKYQEKYRQVVR